MEALTACLESPDRTGKVVVEPAYPTEHAETFRDYRNSHNECPSPPIRESRSAVCHAKRHARHSRWHSDNWDQYSVTSDAERWTITFVESDGSGFEFTMNIGAEKAELRNISKGEFVGLGADR